LSKAIGLFLLIPAIYFHGIFVASQSVHRLVQWATIHPTKKVDQYD